MSPLVAPALFLPILWVSTRIGVYARRKHGALTDVVREDLGVILAANLTLLGLVIGFTFSMAAGHFDQRAKCETAESNAIATELLRVNLLSAPEAERMCALLMKYTGERVEFYEARNARETDQVNRAMAPLQLGLWSRVRTTALSEPAPVAMLEISGMNDVFNAQENARAAWQDRIPPSAWTLIGTVAVLANFFLGYTSRQMEFNGRRLFILPLLVSCSLFLIADMDSPYGGLIHTGPRNLMHISNTM